MTLRPSTSVSFGGRKPHSPPPEAVESKNAGCCGHPWDGHGHLFRKSHSPSLTLENVAFPLSSLYHPSASCGGNTGNQRKKERHCSWRLKKRAWQRAHFVPTEGGTGKKSCSLAALSFILSSTKGVATRKGHFHHCRPSAEVIPLIHRSKKVFL